MFQRCVAIAVLLGMFAAQLARVPHAHAETSPGQQREHDSHPHIHVGSHGHAHDHHEHAPHPDSHHHGVNRESVPPSGGESPSVQVAGSGPNHDNDAVYLPASPTVSSWGERVTGPAIELIRVDCAGDECLEPEVPHLRAFLHPPDDDSGCGRLFLKLRHLRI